MPHSVDKLLIDIRIACEEIQSFVQGQDFEMFLSNRLLQLGLEREFVPSTRATWPNYNIVSDQLSVRLWSVSSALMPSVLTVRSQSIGKLSVFETWWRMVMILLMMQLCGIWPRRTCPSYCWKLSSIRASYPSSWPHFTHRPIFSLRFDSLFRLFRVFRSYQNSFPILHPKHWHCHRSALTKAPSSQSQLSINPPITHRAQRSTTNQQPQRGPIFIFCVCPHFSLLPSSSFEWV